MKKALFIVGLILFNFSSCVIKNPKLESCVTESVKIIKIAANTTNTIVLSDAHNEHYYITKGLEKNLNIEELSKLILNKKVTLYLPKHSIGTSERVAQLVINDTILYTEFN